MINDSSSPGIDARQAQATNGAVAAESLVAHSSTFERRRWTVADRVHCLVGWGLANTTVVEAPGGLIVVDTGECVEVGMDGAPTWEG